ncbi:hypothetical protein [Amycolatopsis sp. NPDC051903]|uniref:hypothetical protein n=1 Tax=Amycolatopsis sp. NPDC051903 TaxID=3363936 RepID=UPI0037A64843
MGSQVTATWVSAIGSAGSLLGFASYVWIMLLNRKDQPEVRQQEQAQSVSARLDEGCRHDRREDYVVCVHNGGDAPAFDCSVTVHRPDEDTPHHLRLAIIPPGSTAVRGLPFGHAQLPADDLYSTAAVPSLSFTDSHGGHWDRTTEGLLTRADRRTVRGRWRTRA